MKEKTIPVTIFEVEDLNELDPSDQQLLASALQATSGAYAPYSHFHVGAAVRLSDGTIITGSNQENVAFPSGLCAERTALFYAQSQYPFLTVEAMAVTAKSDKGQTVEPVYPCGACRQVMLECQVRAGKAVKVIMGGQQKTQIVACVNDLLPLAFENFDLI